MTQEQLKKLVEYGFSTEQAERFKNVVVSVPPTKTEKEQREERIRNLVMDQVRKRVPGIQLAISSQGKILYHAQGDLIKNVPDEYIEEAFNEIDDLELDIK